MSNFAFYITVLVIALTIGSIILPPDALIINNYIKTTPFGHPIIMFLSSFFLGSYFGYMQPSYAKTTNNKITNIFCIFIICLIVLFDSVIVFMGGVEVSVSKWCQNISYESPLACGGCGFLCGHFFGYRK